ncbi:MAG TPA: metallophosphoesterase [Gemmatimonadaceae bacterium]|nr:metallophosphoesterase [Gemmatimonadaceae bacterium]
MTIRKKNASAKKVPAKKKSTTAPAKGNENPIPTNGPQFAQPVATPDPSVFSVLHGSDTAAYKILDAEKNKLLPRPFPIARAVEPVLTLAQAIGEPAGDSVSADIQQAGQIVFHVIGDTGNTKGPKDMELVADKMCADYTDTDLHAVPSFCYHVGDVVYSFGEPQYYYDQFYDPFRNYPAPIFAIPGNHDGMVAPNTNARTLAAFIDNFCATGPSHRTPESGELARTAQIQPSVYFTFEAPFIRIIGLYSNCLEDPGVISTQNGKYPALTDKQLDFLTAALTRAKNDNASGATLIAVHHPPYTTALKVSGPMSAGRHGGSAEMLKEIDAACEAAQFWPHAILSGHAHNYQRFTRAMKDGSRETPFLVSGNGGHAVSKLTHKGAPTVRTPFAQPSLSDGTDNITLENYDDADFGYLRVIANAQQLRIEYHPASDGEDSKTPDDFVTVDIATRKLVHYQALS